jgi:hypothetical protein
MAVEKVNIQMQLVTEYINIFGIIIQLNSVNFVKRRRKRVKQIQANKILNQRIYIMMIHNLKLSRRLINQIFSGTQPRQLVAGRNQRFGNYLCPHHQGCDVTGYPEHTLGKGRRTYDVRFPLNVWLNMETLAKIVQIIMIIFGDPF